jgi:hypothetical protein
MVKNQITLKLALSALAVALLFGCATPTSAPVRAPAAITVAPTVLTPPVVSQEAALDKNETIIDKPAPVQTEVVSLLAKITQAQLTRLNQALKTASDEANSVATVSQATPKIRAFVERLSCIRQYNDGGSAVLQSMAAPGVSFKFFVPPMHGTKLHNKNNCLTVSAIALKPLSYQGLAGIQIKVSYVAEDSGETTTSNHEINKNSKGVWWFTR